MGFGGFHQFQWKPYNGFCFTLLSNDLLYFSIYLLIKEIVCTIQRELQRKKWRVNKYIVDTVEREREKKISFGQNK